MRSFEPVEHGWQSELSVWEREYLAGLLEQVSAVLAAEGPVEEPSSDVGPLREHESERDGEVLAALDFEAAPLFAAGPDGGRPGDERSDVGGPPGDGERPEEGERQEEGSGSRTPVRGEVASLLEVLLPEASEDPRVAVEVSALTRRRLRALKHGRLTEVVAELLEPTGAGGAVLVRRGREGDWLAAVNDVRLVLARRLGIEDAASAQAVHDLAWGQAGAEERDEDRWRRGLAISYDMLTWWQESLLAALWADGGPE